MEKLKKENQIREYFNFYQRKVLPYVEKYATQKKEGYHGLYTHTDAVVFRAIDYALELGENPMPVLFAAACHDMARTHEGYDATHGERALPLIMKVMKRFPKRLTPQEKEMVLSAVYNHTEGRQAFDYVSACLWDADRTRLAWERGYHEKYFNTSYAKKVASGNSQEYIKWQNKILKRSNKDREGVQTISMKKDMESLMLLIKKLNVFSK